jgi:glycosyltransferase involved in cell wall biosynthesis
MKVPCLALDQSCIALAPLSHTPRGIDRVELAYARHFLNHWPGECVTVLPMPWGVRCYDRARALRGLRAVEEIWRETADPAMDDAYARTKRFLSGAEFPEAAWRKKTMAPKFASVAKKYWKFVADTGFSFGRPVSRYLPDKTIYLNVGQLEFFRPAFRWLERRGDIVGVCMIHDVTPIELPEHHVPGGVRQHHSIVRNVAEFAKALIVPSQTARISVLDEMSKYGRGNLPTHVELLPVPSAFLTPAEPDPELPHRSYFIVCGVIDAHKNHLTLLKAWEALVARHGVKAPFLVIAGSPGSMSGPAMNYLDACKSIRKHVLVSSGLSTPALRLLIRGAKVLLMPSLGEGFGLPIVEALAQGTPVIASDIPAHREAGAGGDVTYVAATDVAGWVSSIEAFANGPAPRPAAPAYKPKTWDDYFKGIEGFLAELSRRPV